MSRQPVDSRPLTDDTTPHATLGTQKPDGNVKAAITWEREAMANVRRAIDYYKRAAEFYDKAGKVTEAINMREYAANLNNNKQEL